MQFTSIELAIAWLVGILEGEGTFVKAHSGKNSIRARLCMTDKDVVETAASIIPPSGPIAIYQPKCQDAKTAYSISWSGKAAVVLMNAVLPFMHSRRAEKIKDLLVLAANIRHREKFCRCGNPRAGASKPCLDCHASYERNRRAAKRQQEACHL